MLVRSARLRSTNARAKGNDPEPYNEALPFIEFVGAYEVGSEVDAEVEQFSSHGAYVMVGPTRCYVPLRTMGDPAPRSAREVITMGETYRFRVDAVDTPRRGIDLSLVDPEAVGLGLTAFVGLSAPEQTASWQEKFERVLEEIPEVMDAYQLSGSHDYVLRIVARDMMDYERLRKRIVDAVPVRALSANFVLKRLKAETALPLDTISA